MSRFGCSIGDYVRRLRVTAALRGIAELDRAASDALLDRLFVHIDQPRFHYHHAWHKGDVLMWDNRCTMHAAVPDYAPGVMRLHHRILLRGDVPV